MVTEPAPAAAAGRGRGRGNRANTQTQKKEKGLTDSEKTTLRSLADAADKIPPAIKTLGPALETDKDFFKAQGTEAARVKKRVESILGGNFKAK